MKPPANVSPAPVGSPTSAVGYAGRPNTPSSVYIAEPYSPCLTTTTFGPSSITARAARTRFGSSVSCLTSPSLTIRQSTVLIVLISDSWAMSIHRFIAPSALQIGLDVGQEQHVGVLGRLAELRLEVLEHVEVGLQRVADVDVALI